MKLATIKQITLGTALTLSSLAAFAAPITGAIGYSSTADQNDIERAFDAGLNTLTTGDAEIDTASGDLSGLLGMTIDSVDFTYEPFATPETVWAVGGFSFELQSLNVLLEAGDFLVLSGAGIVSHAGFDDTKFSWAYSTQLGGTFSAGSAAAVPEPATLALLGAGLIGLAASRKSAKH